ncbi:Fibronectin type III domain-containing protein [Ruminococcus sp. YE71]|uniref:fibronectin type III domain-containing protein n=1 Tax=unclassified Ruminococcus TaxID=2608920 RepID=UPI000887AC8D|nr:MULTISPECIES: fibronectin type III domain-containing protein [unclassified Ruminococcus]SDA11986.1 Fibronectin type III domain-containing protein [Ruminococcus sp. YE78]SFW16043.1 Fibronectin type III domain-containing protein [Ruminococcus sp. YE71]
MMKKITAAMLALMMAASAATTVFAETGLNADSMIAYTSLSREQAAKIPAGVKNAPKFTTTKITDKGALIEWEKVQGVDGYLLYRYGGKNGYSHYILNANITSFTWTDFDPDYTYALLSYVNVDGDTIKSPSVEKKGTDFDKDDNVSSGEKTKAPAPTKFVTTKVTDKGALIEWEKVSGVDGYLLYRYGGKNGYSHRILGANTTSYLWEDFDPESTYAVLTYVNVDGDTLKSTAVEKKGTDFDDVKGEVKAPETPKYTKSSCEDKAIRLYWEALQCDGVEIYKSEGYDWELYGTAAKGVNDFLVDGLVSGTEYYFRLRAFNKKADGTKVYSGYTSTITASAKAEIKAPDVPEFTKADSGKDNIRLYWKSLECDGVVVKMLDKNGEWKEAGRVGKNVTNYLVTGLKSGTSYQFRLCAYNKKTDGQLVEGKDSEIIKVSTAAEPVEVKAPDVPKYIRTGRGKFALRLYWEELQCDGVEVWMEKNGSWILKDIAAKDVTNYRIEGLTEGTTYRFKLRAFNTKPDGTKVTSNYTSVIESKTMGIAPVDDVKAPATPKYVRTGVGKYALRLYWEELKCDGVQVWMKKNGMWTLVGTASKGVYNYRIENLSAGTSYQFRMRAFNTKADGTRLFSGYTSVITSSTKAETVAKPAQAKITGISKTSDSVKVYWQKQVCSGYEVYIYKDNKWLFCGTTNGDATSMNITGLTPNTVYYVTVRAFNKSGSTTVFGEFSANTKVTTLQVKKVEAPPAVNVIKISKGKTAVRLTWEKLDCDGYEVYRKINGKFVLSDTLGKDADNIRYGGLTPNTAYYFRIRAFRLSGDGSKVFGEFGKDYKATTLKDPNAGPTIEVKNGVTYVNGVLIANKTYALPASYNPGGLTAETAAAFAKLQQAAKKDGIYLWCASGFRSYSYQAYLYNNYVARDGKAAADTYSARPGHSEHQTGLALDVNNPSSSFNNTAEAKWLAAHCAEYGFIIRYPYGKQNSTGFMYESWHIRYLGVDLAKKVTASGKTLEEYLGITSVYNY